MDDEGDLTVETELAWAGFRSRLADRLAAIADDEVLLVDVETGIAAADLGGCAPHVRFSGSGEQGVRAEVPGNDLLDRRFAIGAPGEAVLTAAGFVLPDGEGELHLVQDAGHRDADRLAVGCVAVLREVWGVVHPAFLSADGLEPGAGDPGEQSGAPAVGDGSALPTSHDELVRLVDAALLDLTDEVEHDVDGDVAFGAGMSVVFVRVCEDRPAVELFAELVMDPVHPERLPVELDILNRTHDFAKFYVAGPAVRMSYLLVAWPFNARQLLTVLRRMLGEVDQVAEALAQRVEGRRFLEEPQGEHDERPEPSRTTPRHPGMVALLELLHLGPVPSPSVAALFEHDRRAIVAHLTGIRTGRTDCGDHDPEDVLTLLRRGLRHVVDGEVPERRPRRIPPRLATEQPSLVPDEELGEDTLDLGWSA